MAHFSHDIVIAGGGLAGLTLAALLAPTGMKVAVIDAAPAGGFSDLRTTAISYGSHKILRESGIWQALQKGICAIEDIKILDGDSPVLLQFLHGEMDGKSFGWICENADLRAAGVAILKKFKNVQHLSATKISDYEVDEKHARAILENGDVHEARVIIGADGRHSFTRQWMDVKTRAWIYDQTAVICAVTHEHPHHNVAVEHFLPGGPFAILPMCDDEKGQHRSAVVFTEHSEHSLMQLSDAEFITVLADRFPAEYGAVAVAGKRAAYPLSLVHAAEYIRPRMALVADAAHAIHPIAGQGLNLGFRDVKAMSDLLSAAYAAGEDLGDANLLETYQRQRRFDNTSFVAVTDALVRLFANDNPALKFLRRAGLKAVSRLSPAKRFFMTRAMGEE